MVPVSYYYNTMKHFKHNDGGRKAAGFFNTNDACIRAMAIACGISYAKARKICKEASAFGEMQSRAIAKGIYKQDFESALRSLGWEYIKIPRIKGESTRVADLPKGRYIAEMTNQFVAVIDNVVNDTADCSHRVIKGYWTPSK